MAHDSVIHAHLPDDSDGREKLLLAVSGLIVPHMDTDETLTDALDRILSNAASWRRMGSDARDQNERIRLWLRERTGLVSEWIPDHLKYLDLLIRLARENEQEASDAEA